MTFGHHARTWCIEDGQSLDQAWFGALGKLGPLRSTARYHHGGAAGFTISLTARYRRYRFRLRLAAQRAAKAGSCSAENANALGPNSTS